MHHKQDIREMGGLKKYMPITYWTALIGSLALIGFPGTSGFFSKDSIIEAVHAAHIPGSGFAYAAVLLGVFITAFYTFRMFFLVFHGQERMDEHTRAHVHESPLVVTVPLIFLAIPSLIIGAMTIEPMLFDNYFGSAILVDAAHDTLAEVGGEFHGVATFILHGMLAPPFWLAMAGLGSAWLIYLQKPQLAGQIRNAFSPVYNILVNKYGCDDFNEKVFAFGGRRVGRSLWKGGDQLAIDGIMVNGTARTIGWFASVLRHIQSGFLYHYAFAMILGLLGMLTFFVFL